MEILINDRLIGFWYVESPDRKQDWRMGLTRLRGGVPQMRWRLRNYGDLHADGGAVGRYDWFSATGNKGDSMKTAVQTCEDLANEVGLMWGVYVFDVVRGPFEPTTYLASRIQRELFDAPHFRPRPPKVLVKQTPVAKHTRMAGILTQRISAGG